MNIKYLVMIAITSIALIAVASLPVTAWLMSNCNREELPLHGDFDEDGLTNGEELGKIPTYEDLPGEKLDPCDPCKPYPDCDACQKQCDKYCREYHGTDKIYGPEAKGKVVDGICNCYCKDGYKPDETLTCVIVKCPPNSKNVAKLGSACLENRKLNHHCCCDEGYKPDKKTLTCVSEVHTFRCFTPFGAVKKEVKEGEPERDCDYYCKQELGNHATGEAIGSGKYPDCWCDCQKGYDPSKISGKCEESCASQCKRKLGTGAFGTGDPVACDCDCMYPYQKKGNSCVYNERDTGPKNLINFLRSLGYNESACPQKGVPPRGSVKFWSKVPSGGIAHSSVVLSNNRQMEMGHKKPGDVYGTAYTRLGPGEKFESAILPKGKNPLTTDDKAFTPYSALPMLCPPPVRGISYDRGLIESLVRTDREFKKLTKWNCYGFSAYAIWKSVETGIRVKPSTKFKWKGKKLVLEEGTIYANRPLDVDIRQGTVYFKSQYTIEVTADKTVIIHLFEGSADYRGAEHSLSLSSGQIAVIDPTGVPSTPTTFNVNEIDKWWTSIEPEKPEYIEPEYSKLQIAKLYTPEAQYNRYDIVIVYYRIENVGAKNVEEYQMRYNIIDPNGKTVYTHTDKKHSIDAGKHAKWRYMWLIPDDSESGEYTVEATLTWSSKKGYEKQHAKTKFRVDWTSWECNSTCRERYGTGAYGKIVNGECKCGCREGYTLDETTSRCVWIRRPTPTPTFTQGFEAVFAIAGLLAVAYLLRRRE